MEKHIIDALNNKIVECRIDHRLGVIRFNIGSLESDEIRYKLCNISRNLRKCIDLIHPENRAQTNEKRRLVYQKLAVSIQEEHKRLIERKLLIEKIKEKREVEDMKASKVAEKARKEEMERKNKIEAEREAQKKINRDKTREQKAAEEKKLKEELELQKKITRDLFI